MLKIKRQRVGPVHLSPAVKINIFIANTEFIHESLQQI